MSSAPRQRYLDQLSTSLFHFILPLLPTPEELNTKQQVRVLIEKLIRTVEPKSRLLAFGSTANGFSLRNSDMDLCVLLDPNSTPVPASELVTLIGNLLERETNFAVKSLPKAYVPIIKLSLLPSPGLPFGIACDIGFENRLALENTRLLLTYATVDPARVRTMVLFVKVWSKRRRINSPYRGTLSSYGYTLLVLFFLIHVQQPSVLPNLQAIPPPSTPSSSPSASAARGPEHEVNGWDVWFFDDTELLRREWTSGNVQSVGELLIDFFRFYCQAFAFNTDVVSIRAGLVTKESKNWTTDSDVGGMNEMSRERNRLCIEDPFERSYNVARTVTKDGLFTIRGEFMRATRILTTRPERAVAALASLCEERDEELMHAPRSRSPRPGPGGGRTPYPGAGGSGYRNASAGGGYSPPKNHYSLPTSSSSLHHPQAHHVHAGGPNVSGGGNPSSAEHSNLHRSQSHSGSSRVPYPSSAVQSSTASPMVHPHAHGLAPVVPTTRTPMFSPLGSPAGSPRARSSMLELDVGGGGGGGGGLASGGPSSSTSPVLGPSLGGVPHAAYYAPLNGLAESQGYEPPTRGRQDASSYGGGYGGGGGGMDAYGQGGAYGEPAGGRAPSQASRGRTGGRVHDLRGIAHGAAGGNVVPGAGAPGSSSFAGSSSGSTTNGLGQSISSVGLGNIGGGGGQQPSLSSMGGPHLSATNGGLPYSSSSTSSSRRAVSTPPPGSGFGVAPLYNERLYAGAGYDYADDRSSSSGQQGGGGGTTSPQPGSAAGSGYTSPHHAHGLPPRPHLMSASSSSHSLSSSTTAVGQQQQQQQPPQPQSSASSSKATSPVPTPQPPSKNAGFAAALATSDLASEPPSFLSPSLLLSPEGSRSKALTPVTEPPLFALASSAHAGAVGDAPNVFPRYPHPPGGGRTRESSRSRTRENSPLRESARTSPLKERLAEGLTGAMGRLALAADEREGEHDSRTGR